MQLKLTRSEQKRGFFGRDPYVLTAMLHLTDEEMAVFRSKGWENQRLARNVDPKSPDLYMEEILHEKRFKHLLQGMEITSGSINGLDRAEQILRVSCKIAKEDCFPEGGEKIIEI